MSKFIRKKSIPDARVGHLLLLKSSDCIIVVGGYNDEGALDDIWELETNKTWKSIKSQNKGPLPRYEFSGTIALNKVFIFGGISIENEIVSVYNDFWIFSLDSYSWTLQSSESPVPERSGHVMEFVSDNCVVVHGGECHSQFDDLWVYKLRCDNWMKIIPNSPSPCARSNHASTIIIESQLMIIFGGLMKSVTVDNESYSQYLNDLWILDCSNSDLNAWSWSQVDFTDIAPSPRDLPGIMSLSDGTIIIFGGYGLVEIMTDHEFENNVDEVVQQGDLICNNCGNDDHDDDADDHNVEEKINDDEQLDSVIEIENDPEDISADFSNIEGVKLLSENNCEDCVVEDAIDEPDSIENDCKNIDEEGDTELVYLSDLWKVNIFTGLCCEFRFENNLHSSRGSKLYKMNSSVKSFGGYDGEYFYQSTTLLSNIGEIL